MAHYIVPTYTVWLVDEHEESGTETAQDVYGPSDNADCEAWIEENGDPTKRYRIESEIVPGTLLDEEDDEGPMVSLSTYRELLRAFRDYLGETSHKGGLPYGLVAGHEIDQDFADRWIQAIEDAQEIISRVRFGFLIAGEDI